MYNYKYQQFHFKEREYLIFFKNFVDNYPYSFVSFLKNTFFYFLFRFKIVILVR